MSAVNVNIDDAAAQRTLSNVGAAAGNPRKGIEAAARVAEQRVRQTYRDESDPWGNPWPPHSPVTLALRERRGNASVQMLIDTAAMFDSIRREDNDGGIAVVIGGPGMFPVVQQFGNPANRIFGETLAPIPARPFFPIRPDRTVDLPADWAKAVFAPVEALMQQAAA